MDGRKPVPTYLKILNGNPGKRPLNENEPQPDIEVPECPDYIRNDDIAYAEWQRIIPLLYDLNLITRIDRATIELYCTQYSLYKKAMQEINKKGLTVSNVRHGEKSIPQIAIAREAAKIIKTIAVEFGLTPSSRGRINVPKEEADDPMEKLLKSAKRNNN
ncbi:MAG: phage terminase small subunit P27 family [Atribacterota bacterium]|nr:phage terminase small subunit P27 family [Atribacterota bacterium]